MKEMTINFILSNKSPNSISGVVTNFANQLSKKGHKIFVSYPIINHWDFYLWSLNQRFIDRGESRINCFMYYLRIYWTIIRHLFSLNYFKRMEGGLHCKLLPEIKHNRYFIMPNNFNVLNSDFIITFQEYFVPRLLWLNRNKGKIISSIRIDFLGLMADDTWLGDWHKKCIDISQKLSIPRFANSRTVYESCLKFGIKVEEVINNGIDIQKFVDGGRRGTIDPINVTCLIDVEKEQKGLQYGLEVIRRVRAVYKGREKVVFRCFGSDSNLGKANAKLTMVFDDVLGFLRGKDFINYLRSTDIFVFPSIFEGFPSLVLEAMACGCAIVTTNVSGVDEFGEHGKNCLVSGIKNVDELVKNVILLIENIELRDKVREGALKTATRYSWENETEKLISFLEKHY